MTVVDIISEFVREMEEIGFWRDFWHDLRESLQRGLLQQADPARFAYEEARHPAVLRLALARGVVEWPDYHRLLRDCYGHCQGLGLGKKDIHLLLREGELLEQALALSPGAEAAHYARAVRLFRQAGGRDRAYHLIFRLARLLDSRPVGPREEPLLLEVLRAALREEYPDGELFVAVARHVLDRALPIARRGKLTLTALSRRLKPRTLFPGLPRGVRELLGLEEILQVGRQMRVCLSSPRAAEGLWAKILSDQGRLLLLEPRRGHGAHLALLGRGEGGGWLLLELRGPGNSEPSTWARGLLQRCVPELELEEGCGSAACF